MNRGAQILSKQLTDRGARRRLAEKLNADPGMISRIVRGDRKPSLPMRVKLQQETGIAILLWDEPAAAELPAEAPTDSGTGTDG